MYPSLFLAHGTPTLAAEDLPYTRFLQNLGKHLPRPQGIAVVSAHWESPIQRITGASRPETLHDFFGYPEAAYAVTYPAPGDILLSLDIQKELAGEGIASEIDDARGLDHGVWPLLHWMYPAADIPVVALSVHPRLAPEEPYRIGQALYSLRQKGVLVIGSGGTVHHPSRLHWDSTWVDSWALEFDAWLGERISVWDLESLFDYERRAPHASLAALTREHLYPLFLAMGLADRTRKAKLLHQEYQYGSLSLTGWIFG
ncbi:MULTISPECIES: DODA-type extradiol aromatic ring-opening family dioxygenase [Paenibacillus]|uniref:DODA-type extradiol aromatic ring-opening family dioxygenase n=1 Tax=Paenibacillus TaxID=44249 RepID=UPI0022B8E59C|nr:class III extradiol ring-cleavage dioxygenase [Paenibacillus caseinilyticus]MCZ8519669.1 class III extradiol ring-cleavage dioxygenase [Paenibacillus caseinilyticus]